MDPNEGGLPPTVPPPVWIENISCYTPKQLEDKRFLTVRSCFLSGPFRELVIFPVAAGQSHGRGRDQSLRHRRYPHPHVRLQRRLRGRAEHQVNILAKKVARLTILLCV